MFIRQFKANDTIFYFSLLVEQSSLVVLATRRSCGIVDIPPITNVAERDSSARDAGARRLSALPDVPRVADIHPGKADPLLPLRSAGGGPGGGAEGVHLGLGLGHHVLGPGSVEGSPVGRQLPRGQETQGIPPAIRVRL